jgi:PAS domain S-box-containing protein
MDRPSEQAEHQRFDRTLSEAIPQQVWTSDPRGALDFVNRRVLDYFQASSDQILGAGWQDVIHPDDLPGCVERWTHSLASGDEYEVEFRLRRADGTYRWHLGRALPLRDAAGKIVKWFGTNTDIDEIKKIREELTRRTEFEQHLLGIVSHDLRNPLNAVVLSAGLLRRRQDLDDRAMKTVVRIQSASERAARMISDLLDFTQARLGGGIRIVRQPTSLVELTGPVLDEMEVGHPGREIRATFDGDLSGEWDGDRLAQVVQNLVSNALKYSPPATTVLVDARAEGLWACLSVHNEGEPIRPENLSNIFEPLKRATPEVDKTGRSIGLGLYIVKQIVDAHGGTVAVTSTQTEGTRVTVRLPRAPL